MKKILLLVVLSSFFPSIFLSSQAGAQERTLSPFYYQRASLFEQLPIDAEDIVFLGNSLTNGSEWHELFNNPNIKNRGISGDVTMGIYNRLEPILKGQPQKIFLLVGVNDISWGLSADSIAGNIEMIVEKIMKESPLTKIYVQSLLPFDDDKGRYQKLIGQFKVCEEINGLLLQMTQQKKVTFINLYPHFIDENTGKLDEKYSNDGLHLMGNGYLLWRDLINPYINN